MINLNLEVELPVEKIVEKEDKNGINKVRALEDCPLIIQQNKTDTGQINLLKGDIKLNTIVKIEDLEEVLCITEQVQGKIRQDGFSEGGLSFSWDIKISTDEVVNLQGEASIVSDDYPLIIRSYGCDKGEINLFKRAFEDNKTLDVFVKISNLKEALEILYLKCD